MGRGAADPATDRVGVTGMLPFEIQAGNDLRRMHLAASRLGASTRLSCETATGTWRPSGDAEMERIGSCIAQGGYIPLVANPLDSLRSGGFSLYRRRLQEVIDTPRCCRADSVQSIDRSTFRGEKHPVGIVDDYWGPTVERWRQQGLGDAEPDYYFDHDIIYFHLTHPSASRSGSSGRTRTTRSSTPLTGKRSRLPRTRRASSPAPTRWACPWNTPSRAGRMRQKHKHLYQGGEWRLHSNPPLSGPGLRTRPGASSPEVPHGKFKVPGFPEPYQMHLGDPGTTGCWKRRPWTCNHPGDAEDLDITFQMLDLLVSPWASLWTGYGATSPTTGACSSPPDVPRPAPAAAQGAAGRLGLRGTTHTTAC